MYQLSFPNSSALAGGATQEFVSGIGKHLEFNEKARVGSLRFASKAHFADEWQGFARQKTHEAVQKSWDDYWKNRFHNHGEGKMMAGGGHVGGPEGMGDVVPAFLSAGEFVVNRNSAAAFGRSRLEKINRYAQGGAVGHVAGDGDHGDNKGWSPP